MHRSRACNIGAEHAPRSICCNISTWNRKQQETLIKLNDHKIDVTLNLNQKDEEKLGVKTTNKQHIKNK